MSLLPYASLAIALAVGIIEYIRFREDRTGKIVVKLDYDDHYGLFGSTDRPKLTITITNSGKNDRKILEPSIKDKKHKLFYKPIDDTIKYPRKIESGDRFEINIDVQYVGDNYWFKNEINRLSNGPEIKRFDLYAEIEDTFGKKYKSNKYSFKR